MIPAALRLLAVAGLLAGCNTVSRGTTQQVAIATVPDGADCAVEQGGKPVGHVSPTPGTIEVNRSREDLQITCAKPGYVTTPVTKSAMQSFVGGTGISPISVLVDASSGANNSYPPTIRVTLPPLADPRP